MASVICVLSKRKLDSHCAASVGSELSYFVLVEWFLPNRLSGCEEVIKKNIASVTSMDHFYHDTVKLDILEKKELIAFWKRKWFIRVNEWCVSFNELKTERVEIDMTIFYITETGLVTEGWYDKKKLRLGFYPCIVCDTNIGSAGRTRTDSVKNNCSLHLPAFISVLFVSARSLRMTEFDSYKAPPIEHR